jgi:single-strand DNA-binding protein
MNRVILIGNLTRDPESRVTQSGLSVCNLNIAVNRRVRQGQDGNAPTADFFRVTVFGKTAENCGRFLAKGRKVGIVGSIQNDNYEAPDGTKRYSLQIIADEVEFLSPAGGGSNGDYTPSNSQSSSGNGYGAPAQSQAPAQPRPETTGYAPVDSGASFSNANPDEDELPF